MYWISVKTDINDNYDYMACSRSARLSYHELVLLMARKEVTALSMGNKQIATALGLSIQETEADLLELIEANLIKRDADGLITIPAISEQVEKFAQKRTATKERVDNWREQKNASKKSICNTDVTLSDDGCNADVTRYNGVTNAQVKVKVKVKEEVKEEEVFAQSANPPPPSKSKSLSEPKEPNSKKTEAEQRRGMFFVKVADVCKIPSDSKPHVRAINAAAVWFTSKPIEPSRLDEFSVWWFANDWRGLKGEYPKPDQIVSEWPKFELGATARKQTQPFAARQTKGEMQMSNIQAGINAFLAGGDN